MLRFVLDDTIRSYKDLLKELKMTSLEDRLLQDMLVLALAGPVVQKVDSTMRWINRYPLSTGINFSDTYPPDNDLSSE